MLKIGLLFNNLLFIIHGQITQEFLRLRSEIFRVLFLYEYKLIGKFSNLHSVTLNVHTYPLAKELRLEAMDVFKRNMLAEKSTKIVKTKKYLQRSV